MKKLFLIIIFFLLTLFIFGQETIVIDSSYGDKELIIPGSYSELKEAYIEMAYLYLEERYDNETLTDKVKSLVKQIDSYQRSVDDYISDVEKLQKAVDSQSNMLNLFITNLTSTSQIISIGATYNILTNSYTTSIGYGLTLFQKFIFFIEYTPITTLGLQVGFKF